jgi:hypothetical protein
MSVWNEATGGALPWKADNEAPSMPHYFFQIRNGQGVTRDDEGIDLPDEAAAQAMAMDSIRSIISEEARKGLIDLDGYIDVKNDEAETLIRIVFPEAFTLRMPSSEGRQ